MDLALFAGIVYWTSERGLLAGHLVRWLFTHTSQTLRRFFRDFPDYLLLVLKARYISILTLSRVLFLTGKIAETLIFVTFVRRVLRSGDLRRFW